MTESIEAASDTEKIARYDNLMDCINQMRKFGKRDRAEIERLKQQNQQLRLDYSWLKSRALKNKRRRR